MKTLPSLSSFIQRTRAAVERAALAPAHATIKKDRLLKWFIIAAGILAFIVAQGLSGRR